MTNKQIYSRWYNKHKERIRPIKAAKMREYRLKRLEQYREQYRKAKAKLRQKLYELYGDECAVCGFTDKRALTLDHINQNGNEERRLLGERGVYYRAIKTHLPLEYRILCMNCQFIERTKTKMAYAFQKLFEGIIE